MNSEAIRVYAHHLLEQGFDQKIEVERHGARLPIEFPAWVRVDDYEEVVVVAGLAGRVDQPSLDLFERLNEVNAATVGARVALVDNHLEVLATVHADTIGFDQLRDAVRAVGRLVHRLDDELDEPGIESLVDRESEVDDAPDSREPARRDGNDPNQSEVTLDPGGAGLHLNGDGPARPNDSATADEDRKVLPAGVLGYL